MPKKIVLNGEVVAPINKRKLPPDVDWQAVATKKQEEAAKAKKREDSIKDKEQEDALKAEAQE